jgi:hypothetical protein
MIQASFIRYGDRATSAVAIDAVLEEKAGCLLLHVEDS